MLVQRNLNINYLSSFIPLRKPEKLDMAFPFQYNLSKIRTIDRLVIDGELYPLGVLVEIFRGNSINCNLKVTGNRPEDRLQIELLEYARDAVNHKGLYERATWMGCGYPVFVVHNKQNQLVLYSWNPVNCDDGKDDGYMLATLLDSESLDLVKVIDQFKFNEKLYTDYVTCKFPISLRDSRNKFFRSEIKTELVHNVFLGRDDNFQFERHLEVVNAIEKELRVSASKMEVDCSKWNFPEDWTSTQIFFFIIGRSFEKFLNRLKSRC